MKPALFSAAWIGLALSTAAAPCFAQLHNNTEKRLSCENSGSNGDRARHCEIREQSLPAVGRIDVDASPNGGVTVKGWLQGGVLVRARVEASGDTQSEADSMAAGVSIDGSGGQVRARGPESGRRSWWSVSYEIFVPQTTDVTLKSVNGGITMSDVRGQLRFDVVNGGVHLTRVAGDITGESVNGGIQVELAGAMFEGRQIDVKTHNGGVTLAMPSHFSAHVQAETGMGHVQSDFPVTMSGELMPRRLDFNVGSGGPLIHIATTNGGVRVKRTESQ
jgi:hypothetical protein